MGRPLRKGFGGLGLGFSVPFSDFSGLGFEVWVIEVL